MIEHSAYLWGTITDRVCDMAQDKMAKDELASRITAVALRHDESIPN